MQRALTAKGNLPQVLDMYLDVLIQFCWKNQRNIHLKF